MRANDLLEPLDQVAAAIGELLSLRSLTGPRARTLGDETTRTLATLGDRLESAAPVPLTVGDPSDGIDREVEAVLDRRPDPDDCVDPNDAVVARLERERRVHVRGDEVIVPLERSGPPARNWRPTFAVVREVVDATLERATTLADRSRASAEAVVADACVAARRMLATLRDVLVRAGSGARVVDRRTNQRQRPPMRFATWVGRRLNGDDYA